MSNLTTEQIEQIVDDISGVEYVDIRAETNTAIPVFTTTKDVRHNLSDLCEILSLRQEVERLHTVDSIIDAAIKACNGDMPNKGVKVSGFINVSSYQGYLVRWCGANPVALCKMQYFEKQASELLPKEQDDELS